MYRIGPLLQQQHVHQYIARLGQQYIGLFWFGFFLSHEIFVF